MLPRRLFPMAVLLVPTLALAQDAVPAAAPPSAPADAAPADAAPDAAAGEAMDPKLVALIETMGKVAKIETKTGTVTIADGKATLTLPEGHHYLEKADARFYVSEVWGNPPSESILGLVLNRSPLDDMRGESGEGYGIIISYEDMGHVDDDDAEEMDYEEMMKELKADEAQLNAQRTQAGYPEVHLLGWAEPPHYDAAAKKIFWAKTAKFGDSEENTLNYDVRILGRSGVLVMRAVGVEKQLKTIAEGCQAVLAKTEFVAGERHADFDSKIDKVAAVGIGGLVAGKVLAKAGLFKVLLKPIMLLGAGIAAMFGRRKKKDDGFVPPPNDVPPVA